MRSTALTVDERTLRRWDSLVVLWVTLWLVVGAAVGFEIWQLTAISRSTVASGQALDRAGQALTGLADTPVIGGSTGKLGSEVSTTAASIVSSGQQAGSSIRGLSVLIGFAVAGIPVGSALGAYLPMRRARGRDAAGIRAALDRDGLTAPLRGYLAGRAVAGMPSADLLAVSADPHADLAAGRHHALAVAELDRLGIRVPVGV